MENKDISSNLLYTQKHFDLLHKLYRYSFDAVQSEKNINSIITESVVEGLNIDRASIWKIEGDKLVCINLFDKIVANHQSEKEILASDYPIYFKALCNGIAIVANNAIANKYTSELKDNYLIPLEIVSMLDLPIRENGMLVGVLCCENRLKTKNWSDADMAFARSITDIYSIMKVQFQRKIIENELIESKRKLSLITETSKDGFVVFENREVTYISPNYAKLIGYDLNEIHAMSPDDVFNHMHPDDVENVKNIIYENLSKKVNNFKYQHRLRNKSGKYLWREDAASVIYDNDGLYSKYIIISRDISAMKETESKIEKLYALSKSQNEKLLDFTHIISHNIRSNTSNMTMIINLIDETDDEAERKEYFQLLKESNAKLSDTIYYLNETINVKLNTSEQKVPLSVKSEIEKTLIGINGIIKSEKAEININVTEDCTIKSIPSYFESIMFNLITNAIKYKSPDRNPIITIELVKKGSKCIITVKDNGLGIDMNRNKDKIFGMYKTFHGNSDAVGLGLFMTKNHVEALGGTIELESEVGKGSKFKLTFDA